MPSLAMFHHVDEGREPESALQTRSAAGNQRLRMRTETTSDDTTDNASVAGLSRETGAPRKLMTRVKAKGQSTGETREKSLFPLPVR